MNCVILIPARYGSTRFPGKPLAELKGATGVARPLIQRSVEAAKRVAGVSGLFVATDDDRTPVSELEALEGLEQLRFLGAGMRIAVVDVATPPFALRELNNPEDVAPIEQALAEAGLE